MNSLEAAGLHVIHNAVPANDRRRRCVDGRYEQATEDSGSIATAGADWGFSQAGLALKERGKIDLHPKDLVDTYLRAYQDMATSFFMHTDDRIDHERNSHLGFFKFALAEDSASDPVIG